MTDKDLSQRIVQIEDKNDNFLVLFGSEDEVYSDDGEDMSGHPYWKPLMEVASKHGPALGATTVTTE
jgi:hypothetical protein